MSKRASICALHYSKERIQSSCISFIEDTKANNNDVSLSETVRSCNQHGEFKVHIRTLHRWWHHYEEWGELPVETSRKKHKYTKLMRQFGRTRKITNELLSTIKAIIEEDPELYLDEIASELARQTKKLVPLSTLHGILRTKLGLSLQVCYESALQRSEIERTRYQNAMNAIVSDVAQLVFIDETHKDRNASRRRKAWGKRNSGGLALKKWFSDTARYTLIAAMDVQGFIPSTLDIVHRDEISDEGAAGTVDAAYFEEWVEKCLCPVLGRYDHGEPRSIVVMDNASTHMSQRVADMIRATGAYLLYTAPYSPDLNPIELAFNVYKASLKRNSDLFKVDWNSAHGIALDSVTRDICITEFRRCGVPGSYEIRTADEEEELAIAISLALDIV